MSEELHTPRFCQKKTLHMNPQVFFKISYGLYVVGSIYQGKMNGFVSNTVFQVTSQPPQFAVACHKENFSAGLIRDGKVFSISIIRRDYRPEIIGTFGYRSGKDLDKFSGFRYHSGITGVPILLEDTIGYLECNLVNTFDMGTHLLFIGDVIEGDIFDDSSEPLTYTYYHNIKKGKAPKHSPTYIEPQVPKRIPRE